MKKILIVDDEKEIRDLLSKLMIKEGYEPFLASSGAEGLDAIANNKFNLALIDVQLGDIDGIEILQKIKREYPTVEVLMMSGFGTFVNVIQIIKSGAQDFIEKPFDPDILVSKVQKAWKVHNLNVEFKYLDEQYNSIKELKDYNESVINQLPIGLVTINRNDEMVYCNTYIKNKFCSSTTQCPCGMIHGFINRNFDATEKILSAYETLVKKNEPFDFVILNNTRETNKGSHFRIMGSRFSAGCMLFINDITENFNIKQKLIANEKISNMGKFILGITHGLGNNMANIIANASGVEDEVTEFGNLLSNTEFTSISEMKTAIKQKMERINDYSSRLLKRAYEMDVNIKSLLSYSRQQPVIRSLSDINIVVEEAAIVVLSNNYPNITFVKDLNKNIPKTKTNPHQIKDIFVDLMLNAVQSIEGSGTIKYKTEFLQQKNCIRVSITDTGCGIPLENKSKIWTAFFTTKKKGTGLGLANVKSIVKQHDGEIDFTSEPGKGTTFIVDLPVID